MKTVYERKEVIDLLRQSVVTVNFTKTDGSVRNLKCTLLQEFIPEDKRPKTNVEIETDAEGTPVPPKPRKKNLDVVNAFDVENDDWRSFRLDSINSIEV